MFRSVIQTRGARVATVGLLACSVALSACSSGSGSDSAGSGIDANGEKSAELQDFETRITALVDEASAEQTPDVPTTGPTAQTGKKVVIIPPAGAATEGGYRVALAAQDAAQALGWEVTFINPEGDPSKMNAAVQQAIAINADGIMIDSIDASVVQSSLEQAAAQGIVITAAVSANTDGETGVFDSLVPSLESGQQNGYVLAAQAYLLQDGRLRDVQMMDNEFGYVVARQQGWQQFISDCQDAGGDCETLNTTNFLAADITTKLPSLTAQTLRSNSGFNVLWSGFDSGLDFMLQGATQAGLMTDETIAVGFDGNTPNLNDIREGGYQKATVGLSTLAIGYAMADNMNRIFAGEDPLTGDEQGIVNKLLTADNVPSDGGWWGDVDVRESYWATWGVTPSDPAAAADL